PTLVTSTLSLHDALPIFAFLVGCVMPILYPQSHDAAVKLLQIAGCEVWFPQGERCCGALHAHGGDLDEAERLRESNMHVYAKGEDRKSTRLNSSHVSISY